MRMESDINFITVVGYVKDTFRAKREGRKNETSYFSITSDPNNEDSERSVFFVHMKDPGLEHFASQLKKGTKVVVKGEYHDRFAYLFETILNSQRIDAYSIDVVRKIGDTK